MNLWERAKEAIREVYGDYKTDTECADPDCELCADSKKFRALLAEMERMECVYVLREDHGGLHDC